MNIDEYKAMKAQEDSSKEETTEEQPKDVDKQVQEPQDEQVESSPDGDKEGEQHADNVDKQEEKQEEKQVFNIDGQEVTIDELTKGYLRQSDYTKKTQDLARKKKELESLQNKEPTNNSNQQKESNPEIRQLQNEIADMKLEKTITDLSSRYDDFDEIEVLNEAFKRGIDDLEFVYKAIKSDKPSKEPVKSEESKESSIDMEAIKREIREEVMKEIASEQKATQTIISNKDVPTQVEDKPSLSKAEKKVAKAMGMSDDEYIKWR